jgi:hypothetical protein
MQLNPSKTTFFNVTLIYLQKIISMKKNYFLGALLFISSLGYSQKTIIVNGGQFGNPNEMANVQIYDPIVDSSRVIDTIRTGSVQEIIYDGFYAYVTAQDSIIMYDLTGETRLAAAGFNGVSTKSMAISGNELLVGNWYGKTSDNLYIYDKTNLTLLDSISGLTKGVKSILVNNGIAYIPQNQQTAGYSDSLGYIVKLDIANRVLIDTINVLGYTEDFGELVEMSSGLGFLSVNSTSNTITSYTYGSLIGPSNTSFSNNLNVSAKSHYSVHNDTMFLRLDNGISSLDMNSLMILDTNIIDTIITAFSYDTLNAKFYVTQTNFISYIAGKEYNRSGVKTRDFSVGFSPEVIRMYYGFSLAITEANLPKNYLSIYPNPSSDFVAVDLEALNTSTGNVRILNLNGQSVVSSFINKSDNFVSLRGLSSGVYILTVNTENGMFSARVIKE